MILRDIAPKRAADDIDLSDITSSMRTGEAYWLPDNVLVIPFDKDPTKAEADRIRRRLITADAAEEAALIDLIATRKKSTSKVEQLLLDAELAKHGEKAP